MLFERLESPDSRAWVSGFLHGTQCFAFRQFVVFTCGCFKNHTSSKLGFTPGVQVSRLDVHNNFEECTKDREQRRPVLQIMKSHACLARMLLVSKPMSTSSPEKAGLHVEVASSRNNVEGR